MATDTGLANNHEGLEARQADHEPSQQAAVRQNAVRQNAVQPNASLQHEAFLVRFDNGDPDDPKNWNSYYKAFLTFQLGLLALVGSFGTSIVAPALPVIAAYLDVSEEVAALIPSLFMLGFAFGPMLWAPISEVHGRKLSMLPPLFVLGLFSIGTATSKSAAAIFITRFLGGVFASAPISNVAAALGDFYPPRTRGIAMAFYAVCVVGGPTLSPIIGAALTVKPGLGWRWTEYLEAILSYAVLAFAVVFLPETYPPILLKRKAQQMRNATGDDRYWHPQEKEKISMGNIITKYLSRPLRMLFTEPMVSAIACYASFIYGLLFLTLEAFPIVFSQERQWSLIVSTTPFLALFVGVLIGVPINLSSQGHYARAMEKNKGRPVPEARLPPMMIGAVFIALSLFWFGWTASPSHHWALPVVAAGFLGGGFSIAFQQCINFLVDTYGPYAASATAANTVLRSVVACGLPMAARPMFLTMGVGPACSVLGGIACLALPVPLIFMKYGLTLRRMSKFAPVVED